MKDKSHKASSQEQKGKTAMEDEKNNELADETLDTVAGGAFYKHNILDGLYYVYRRDGTLFRAFNSEFEAAKHAMGITEAEKKIYGDGKPKEPQAIVNPETVAGSDGSTPIL